MNLLLRATSVALLLAAWFAGSHIVGARLLPEPQVVALAIVEEARSGALGFNLGVTLARVVASFAIAMALGSVIGLAMGRVLIFDRLADSWLVVLLNMPALVIIVLAYMWAGLTETAAIIAVALNKLPKRPSRCARARARSTQSGRDGAVFRDGRWHACATSSCRSSRPTSRSRPLRPVAGLEDRADRRTARPTERRRLRDRRCVPTIRRDAHPGLCAGLHRGDARHRNLLVQPIERHVSRWRPRPA